MKSSEQIFLEELIEKYEKQIETYQSRQARTSTWTKNKNMFKGMESSHLGIVKDLKERLEEIERDAASITQKLLDLEVLAKIN
tara:strand:+ start:52 stop:300 length:249 start_codon:yes stop_codon:yes gene_type:complete